MLPFERDLYVDMLVKHLEEEKKKTEEQERKLRKH